MRVTRTAEQRTAVKPLDRPAAGVGAAGRLAPQTRQNQRPLLKTRANSPR